MKNLFEQSRSHWVRYDRYELKTAADGNRYITPGKNAKPDIYNPLKEAPGIVLDALNVGMLMMNRSPEDEVQKAKLSFSFCAKRLTYGGSSAVQLECHGCSFYSILSLICALSVFWEKSGVFSVRRMCYTPNSSSYRIRLFFFRCAVTTSISSCVISSLRRKYSFFAISAPDRLYVAMMSQ